MYKRPSYNIKTSGSYIFKTKDKNYKLESFLFERQNDTEDSLQIQDELRGELGSIIIKNSVWNKLSKGDAIRAKSSKGNISGTLVRVEKMATGGGVGNDKMKVNITKNEFQTRKDDPNRVFHSYEGNIGDYTFTAETDSNGTDGINKGSIYKLDIYNEKSNIARYNRKWEYRSKNTKDGAIRSTIVKYIDSISNKKDGEPRYKEKNETMDKMNKYAGGGEIEGKISDLQAVIDGDFPQFAKDKAKSEIERLEKELHESKETKAEEKAEHSEKIKMYISEFPRGLTEGVEDFIKEHKLSEDEVLKMLMGYNQGQILSTIASEAFSQRLSPEKKAKSVKEVLAFVKSDKAFKYKKPSYKLGDQWAKDFDYKGLLEYSLKVDENTPIKTLEKLHSSFEDNNYHTLGSPLWDAYIDLKKGNKDKARLNILKFRKGIEEELTDEFGWKKLTIKTPAKKVIATKELVGYAIVDPISTDIMAFEETIPKLIQASKKLETKKGFEDIEPFVYEVIKKGGKKSLGDKITSVDINLLPIGKDEAKFKVGESVQVKDGLMEMIIDSYSTNRKGEIVYKGHFKSKPSEKFTEKESEIEVYKKPKPDHKKLLAKIKAKKTVTPSNAPSKGHKRSESSDKKRDALPLGKRVSENGNVYYENRLNRADMNKEDKFEGGGEIGKNSSGWGLKFLNW